jgi:hypothetical protein
VKATLRLEVERVSQDEVEQDSISECGSFSNSSIDGEGRDNSLSRHLRQGSSGFSKGAFNGRPKWTSMDKRRLGHSASASSFEFPRPPVYLITILGIPLRSVVPIFAFASTRPPVCDGFKFIVAFKCFSLQQLTYAFLGGGSSKLLSFEHRTEASQCHRCCIVCIYTHKL